LGEISKRVGLKGNETSFYLSVLRDAGFVKREVPISKFNNKDTRTGRYFVTDPYLRFYYRFLASFQSKLALGQQQQALQSIETALPQFVEDNTWQELCRNWMLGASDREELPLPVTNVGSEWWRNGKIDVVGIDKEQKSLILGDCFWRDQPVGVDVITNLVRKTTAMLPGSEDWQVSYIIFSANGWTEKAESKAEEIINQAVRRARKKWIPCGIRLVDLPTLDKDLDRWANA